MRNDPYAWRRNRRAFWRRFRRHLYRPVVNVPVIPGIADDYDLWPWECPGCISGIGKGETIGRSGYHRTLIGDTLCETHRLVGVPPRNRAERRQIIRDRGSRGPKR